MSKFTETKPLRSGEGGVEKPKRISGYSVEESNEILSFLKYLIKMCPAEHFELYTTMCEGFIYADIDVKMVGHLALTQRSRKALNEFEVWLTDLVPGSRVVISVEYLTRGEKILDIDVYIQIRHLNPPVVDLCKVGVKKRDCIKLLQLFKVPLKYDGIDKVIKE